MTTTEFARKSLDFMLLRDLKKFVSDYQTSNGFPLLTSHKAMMYSVVGASRLSPLVTAAFKIAIAPKEQIDKFVNGDYLANLKYFMADNPNMLIPIGAAVSSYFLIKGLRQEELGQKVDETRPIYKPSA